MKTPEEAKEALETICQILFNFTAEEVGVLLGKILYTASGKDAENLLKVLTLMIASAHSSAITCRGPQ